MMITKEQALNPPHEIHYVGRGPCTRKIGPHGGETISITRVRPSGRCQTWKTRPEDFRLPIKYGMYESSEITQDNAAQFHTADDCPLSV